MKKALVLSLVAVLCLGAASFAQTLSGKWNTTVTIIPSPVSLSINSELIVTYSISGWSFTSDTVLTQAGWQSQDFTVVGTLGAFTINSDLVFDPATLSMIQWVSSTELSLAGVDLTAKFVSVPGDTALILTGAGTAGNVTVSADLTLGTAYYNTDDGIWEAGDGNCGFAYQGIDFTLTFPFCCADVTAGVDFTCAGFQQATFEVDGIAVPTLPWFTFDAQLVFQTGSKTIVLTPHFSFGNDQCFKLYISQDHDASISLGNIHVNGLSFTCTLGGVTFYDLSYWGTYGTKPSVLGSYWELFKLSTTDDACCGPFSFDLSMYFSNTSAQLFDVSKVVANMGLQVAQQFKFSTGFTLNLDSTPVFSQWTLGFLVTW